MKKVLFLLGFVFLLNSCTVDSGGSSACLDGNCDATFWIDTNVNPGSYLDSKGVWHVKYSGRNYFTLKGFNIKHIKLQVTNSSGSTDTFKVFVCA